MRVQQPVLTTAESGHALRRHQGFAIRRRDRRGVGGRQAQPRHWRRDLVAAAHLYPRLLWLRRDTSDTGAVAAVAIDLLVRAADAADVPCPAGAVAQWGWLLACTRLVLPCDAFALCRDGVDARETRHLPVTGDRDFAGTGTGPEPSRICGRSFGGSHSGD